ncbi:MAG: glycosyltransferase family 4 protein, partial [Gemmataceae bacterium]|nr:glycosyltransferase family 4 protein [Gemmataceae bacterium]
SNGIKTHLLSSVTVPAGIRLIWHIHDFYSQRRWSGWLLRRLRLRVTGTIAVSQAIAADLHWVLPGVPITVVPNAVDTEHFCPGPAETNMLDCCAGLPIPNRPIVRLGLVATYARWKGHLVLLDAIARLLTMHPSLPARWYLIGGPIYHTTAQFTETELRDAVRARGLQDRIGFIPFVADPVPIYRSLDVVVHASNQPEPFGLTIVEAMACGRAVIVSAAGGAAELFTHGVDAWGVRPGDVQELAEAMFRLSTDADLRRRLGQAARCTAVERFDRRLMGQRLLQLYRSLIPSAIDC